MENGMQRRFRDRIWKMPEWNGRFQERNGRQSSILPHQFHTRFRGWQLVNISILVSTHGYGGRVLYNACLDCCDFETRVCLVVAGMGLNPIHSHFSDNQRLIQSRVPVH